MPAFVLALAMFQHVAPKIPEQNRGAKLYEYCQAQVDLTGNTNTSMGKVAQGSLCAGYIQGFVDAVNFSKSIFCVGSASTDELIQSYLSYMKSHPNMMPVDKSIGLTFALASRFSCPQQDTDSQPPQQQPETQTKHSHRARRK